MTKTHNQEVGIKPPIYPEVSDTQLFMWLDGNLDKLPQILADTYRERQMAAKLSQAGHEVPSLKNMAFRRAVENICLHETLFTMPIAEKDRQGNHVRTIHPPKCQCGAH